MSEENYHQKDEADDASTSESKSRAFEDMEAILALRASRPFQHYFLRRLKEKIRAQEEKILDERTPESDIGKERAILATLKSIARMTEEDAAGCKSILNLQEEV